MVHVLTVGKTPVIRSVNIQTSNDAIQAVQQPLDHHTTIVSSITALKAKKGQFMLTSYDKTVSIIKSNDDCSAFEKVVQFKAHDEEVMCSCEIGNGRVVSGGFDSCFKIWNLDDVQEGDSSNPVNTVKTEHPDLACFRIQADKVNNRLYMLSVDNFVRLYDSNTCEMTYKIQAHEDRVRDVHFNSQNATLTTVGDDNRVQLWDMRGMQLIHTLSGTKQQTMCVTACGQRIIVGGITGDLKIYDTRNLKATDIAMEINDAHDKVISNLEGISATSFASIGGSDGIINWWDVTTGQKLGHSETGDVLLDLCVAR
jgi:WD40 repeat protein